MYDDLLRHRAPPVKADNVRALFDSMAAAPAVPDAIPRGKYEADWIEVKEDESSKGTPRIVLIFEIIEGDFAGRKVWLDLYLTAKAMPQTKRKLAKLGIENYEDWRRPVPHWIRCTLRVVVETSNDGKQRNKIENFEVIAFDEETPDPFAPNCQGGDE